MSEKQATILDLDNMMDMSMDAVEDIADFVTPPAGNYMLKISDCKTEKYTPKATAEEKNPKEGARIRITYEVVDTIECEGLPVKNGSLFSEQFTFTEDGVKYFKKQARNILNVEGFPGATLKDVIDGIKNAEFKCALTITKSPNPQGGTYENVRIRPVHAE